MRDDVEMTVDFGRVVETDKIVLFTRADFPHDNWWRQVHLNFSDGTDLVWDMEKSSRAHRGIWLGASVCRNRRLSLR